MNPIVDIHETLGQARRVLICGHVRPDGDCVGSMAAARAWLLAQGKETRLFFRGPVQAALLEFLPDGQGPSEIWPDDFHPDVILCLDSSTARRIADDFLERAAQTFVINIDHHADNSLYGQINWIDPSAASVGEMLHDLLDAHGPEIPSPWTPEICQALYLAVASDTGGFRYGNTTPRSLETASRLARHGAAPAVVASALWGERPLETVRIEAAVLGAVRFDLDQRFAWAELTQETINRHGGPENEPDNLSGALRAIRGVEVAALVRETPEGGARASIRSKGRVDVSRIAARLGGGGHPSAAGAETHESDYARSRELLVKTIIEGTAEQLNQK